jgi:hypothetical protein
VPPHQGIVHACSNCQPDHPCDVCPSQEGNHWPSVECSIDKGELEENGGSIGHQCAPVEATIDPIRIEDRAYLVLLMPEKIEIDQIDGRPGNDEVEQEQEEVRVVRDEVALTEYRHGSANHGSSEQKDDAVASAGVEALPHGDGRGRGHEHAIEIEHVGRDNTQDDEEVDQDAESESCLFQT